MNADGMLDADTSATDSLRRFPISTYGAYVELPRFLTQSIFNIFSF
jgi:hypothetical protein